MIKIATISLLVVAQVTTGVSLTETERSAAATAALKILAHQGVDTRPFADQLLIELGSRPKSPSKRANSI
jgi:hypothetical protein